MSESPSINAKIDNTLTIEDIRSKIAQLSVTEEGVPLKTAMDDLKTALRHNPAACAAILPEDIGEMVKYLMKVTGKIIEEDLGAKKEKKASTAKAAAKTKIDFSDPSVLAAIEDDLLT